MKAVIQRVSTASVTIDNLISAEIQSGLLVFVGIETTDSQEDIQWLSGKIANLRIFADENEVMNKSVKDIDGEILIISQFTLHASTKKGNGQWKWNCLRYLADKKDGKVNKGIFDIHVIDVYFTSVHSSPWVFDIGSVAKINNSK